LRVGLVVPGRTDGCARRHPHVDRTVRQPA
jgi:hypothetical protein